MIAPTGRYRRLALCIVIVLCSFTFCFPLASIAQNGTPAGTIRSLSLNDALKLATQKSDELGIAQAGVRRAEGNQTIATSQFLPQVNLSVGYTRTLKSQYSGITGSSSSSTQGGTDTTKGGSSSSGASSLFSNLPFGKENQWSIGLTASQNIYTGGRITALREAADARKRSADIDVTSANAQLVLNVTQSYYDAILSDQLVQLAQESLKQTQEEYDQTNLAYKVGERPEFDALRARVARDNQIPVLLQRQSDRSLAYDRLKQLLNVPLNDSLVLTTGISDSLSRFDEVSDTTTEQRSVVRQATENIAASEAQLRVSESERLPQVSISSRYAPVAYPSSIFPTYSDFRTDWTVSVNASIPLYTGGRITGDEEVARAGIDEARARWQQTAEAAQLDAHTALQELAQSRSLLISARSTSEQARKALEIARVRYKEGISTQLELTDTRIQEEQAVANESRAVRNYQVAKAKAALLKDLPVSSFGGAATQAAQQQAAAAQASQQQASPQQTTSSATQDNSVGVTGAGAGTTGIPTSSGQ